VNAKRLELEWLKWAGGLVIVGLLIALFWSTFRWLIYQWWTNDYYSHGPLVPLISAFFIWRGWAKVERQPSNWGLVGLVAGLVLYLTALRLRAPFLSALSFIVIPGGLIIYFLGVRALNRFLLPLTWLVFMIPLPLVEAVSSPLQVFTVRCSTLLVQALGIPALNHGGQIALESCSLVIGAPCSGLRSLIVMLALATVVIYVITGPWLAKLLLFLLAVPVALVANIGRVTSLLIIAHFWGREVASGYYHNLSGPIFFLVGFALLLFLSRRLGCREIRSDIW
jgi:exosortase